MTEWECWNSSHTVPNVQLVEIYHCRGIFDYFATGDTEPIICNYHDLSWRFVIPEDDWNARAEYQLSQEKGIEWSRRTDQRLKTSGFPCLCNLVNYCVSYLIQPGHWWDFHLTFWHILPLQKQPKKSFGFGRFLKELHQVHIYPIPLYCDNQGPIALAKNPENHQRTKHYWCPLSLYPRERWRRNNLNCIHSKRKNDRGRLH